MVIWAWSNPCIMSHPSSKDNADPVIYEVQETRSGSKEPVGWSDIEDLTGQRWKRQGQTDDQKCGRFVAHPQTSEDRAVILALCDVMTSSKGQGVGLLRRVGMRIPESREDVALSAATSAELPCRPERSQKHHDDARDAEEIFDIIRSIQDPEHPLTLEQLGVVSREQIQVNQLDSNSMTPSVHIQVRFTPTVPHCSMATLIGLSMRVKLLRSLPNHCKVTVRIEPGTHQSEHTVNKQLADKERVCAALENPHLLKVVDRCIRNGMTGEMH